MGRSKKLIPLFLGLGTMLASLITFYNAPFALRDVGNLLFDQYQRWQPRVYSQTFTPEEYVKKEFGAETPEDVAAYIQAIEEQNGGPLPDEIEIAPPVKVIDIDEESLEKLGQWPWPRTDLAKMTQRLAEAGAAVVVFDVVFSETDRTSPPNIAPLLIKSGFPVDQEDLITKLPDHDTELGATFSNAPVVTGFFLTAGQDDLQQITLPPTKASFVELGLSGKAQLPNYQTSTRNLEVIDAGANGSGFVSVASIEGGLIRKAPLLARIDDNMYPSLSVEALRVYSDTATIQVKSSAASGQLGSGGGDVVFMDTLRVANRDYGLDFQIPVNGQGEFLVHYTEYDPDDKFQRRIPAWKVIKDDAMSFEELQQTFYGQVVLVGPSAPGLLDLRSTPMNASEPGVLIHAQMLEQMFSGQFLERPYETETIISVIILLGGILLAVLLSFLGAVRGGIFVVAALGILFWYSWNEYSVNQILFDPTFAAAALLAVSGVTILSSFYLTESEKAEIRGAFDHYLSPDMVDKITDDPSLLQLGGEEREITILFCDIRSFSKISEKLTPQELITFLNNFLTPMTEILMDSRSTIDKYIGDAIMSFWNAPLDDPDHARNACRGSLNMIHKLREMNEIFYNDPENAPLPVETNIGIGLNSGPCSVGNMGSTQRFAYSVLGDAVNLSSRVEGLTKQYKVHILIGSATAERADDFAFIEADRLRVVGREAPETIYTLVGDDKEAKTPQFQEWRQLQTAYLEAYRSQDWDEAERIAELAKPIAGQYFVAGYYDVMQARIDEYRQNPPGEEWDGVYQATSK